MNRKRCPKPFVLYQLVISLGTLRIVHCDGPHKGCAVDVTIARDTIVPLLEPGERLLADKAYRADDQSNFLCPPPGISAEMFRTGREFAGRVHEGRQCVERVIERVQNFNVVNGSWRFSLELHQKCFRAIVHLVNMSLEYMPLDKPQRQVK